MTFLSDPVRVPAAGVRGKHDPIQIAVGYTNILAPLRAELDPQDAPATRAYLARFGG